MIKNIGSSFKKALSNKVTYMYFIGIIVLILIANVAVVSFRMIYGANEGTYAYNLLEYATWCFVIPYYTCVFIADIGFGKEYPNPHIKDGITGHLSRVQIYLSKLIVSLLLGAVFMVIAILSLLAITSLFQINDGGLSWYSVKDFLRKVLIAIPIWYTGVALGMLFLFIFNRKRNAFVGYFIFTLVIPRIIMFFAAEPFKIPIFRFIRTYTLTQNVSLIPYSADPARNVPLTVGLGILYGTVATIVGCVVFNRKKFD